MHHFKCWPWEEKLIFLYGIGILPRLSDLVIKKTLFIILDGEDLEVSYFNFSSILDIKTVHKRQSNFCVAAKWLKCESYTLSIV